MDTWKAERRLTITLGLRYEWNSTPTEGGGRYVVFDPTTVTLQNVGAAGAPSEIYNQSALNFWPSSSALPTIPFGTGKTVVRGAFAIMVDQPGFGLVTNLVNNPPYAVPLSSTTAGLSLLDAYTLAKGSVSPISVAHNYKNAYVSQWNFGVEHQFGQEFMMAARYVGSKGTDLNIERNYNQFVNGVRPYAALSASSPIDPGVPLSNITVYESDGIQPITRSGSRRRSVSPKDSSLTPPTPGRNRSTTTPAISRAWSFRTATIFGG